MLYSASLIILKDLRLLLRDKPALFILLVLPLLFISILGLSTGQLLGWKQRNQQLKIAVVNLDGGAVSQEVVESLKLREGVVIVEIPTREEASVLVTTKKCSAAVILGPQFQERVEELHVVDLLDQTRGRLSGGLDAIDVQVEQKPLFASVGAIVRQLILAESMRILTPHVVRRNRLISNWIDKALNRPPESPEDLPPEQQPRPAASPAPPPDETNGIYEVLVPAYTVMFVFFLVQIMARSFLAELSLGTLRRLRLAPIPSVSILIGKTVPFLLLSIIQTGLLFLSGKLIFGMSWGSEPWLLLPVMICTSFSATTLGLLTATVVRTESQVEAYATFLVIMMAAISGVFMPRDWLPMVMQQVSLVTPHAWALIAYDEVLTHRPIDLAVVTECCGALLTFTAVFFTLGWWRFRSMT